MQRRRNRNRAGGTGGTTGVPITSLGMFAGAMVAALLASCPVTVTVNFDPEIRPTQVAAPYGEICVWNGV